MNYGTVVLITYINTYIHKYIKNIVSIALPIRVIGCLNK